MHLQSLPYLKKLRSLKGEVYYQENFILIKAYI